MLMSMVKETEALAEQLSDAMEAETDIIISLTQTAWDHYNKSEGELPITAIIGSSMQLILNACQQLADANAKERGGDDTDTHHDFYVAVTAVGLLLTDMADRNQKRNPGNKQ